MRKSFFVFCLLFTCHLVSGQSLKQWESLGDEAMQDGNPAAALVAYREAFMLDSSIFDLTVKYAEALRLTKDYKNAAYYYEKAYNKDRGKLFPKGQFYLAEMQKFNGNYTQALRNFKKYAKKVKRDKTSFAYQKTLQEIASCTWAINARKTNSDINIQNLGPGVNTAESEFAPFPFSDSLLYYTSYEHPNSADSLKIYSAVRIDSTFQKDLHAHIELNNSGMSNGNLSFSPDRTRAYFTRCENGYCTIYETHVTDGSFGSAKRIPTISCNDCYNTMPSIGVYDGIEYLFYASDRPGTRGQLDIWWCERLSNGEFGPPVNAGDNINSPGNEITPFYFGNRLFFSSDWHVGFGGFDVSYSKGYPRSFDVPINPGYPLNSSLNDLYFVYDTLADCGYFASNRPGSQSGPESTCCNDIYQITFLDSVKVTVEDPVFSSLKELNSYLPVTLYFHNDEPNPNTRDTITNLTYLEAYENYLKLKPKYIKENTRGLSGEEKENAVYDIEDFFEFKVEKGRKDLEQFTRLLLKELESGRQIQLTIKGFASPRAQSDYNVNLTKRRISSLVNYLREYNGGVFIPYIDGSAISGGRLTFEQVPFGEYLADQQVSDELSDEKQSIYSRAASLERKIEIQSVERAQTDSLYGEFTPQEQVHNFGKIPPNLPVAYTFVYYNTGTDTLRIDSVASTCHCTVPDFNKTVLLPGEQGEITVRFNPEGIHDEVVRTILIYTSAGRKPKKLVITANVME